MKISASVEYGARLMVCLGHLKDGEALTGEKLSTMENIPRAYVDQILQRLRKAGLVDSQRGAQGGYHLAHEPKDISLGAMMRAVDGMIFEDVCGKYASGENQCAHVGGCGIRPVWMKLTSMIEDYLEKVTLSDLLEEAVVFRQ